MASGLILFFFKCKKYIKSIKNILNKTEKEIYVTQCYELGDMMKAGRRATTNNNFDVSS